MNTVLPALLNWAIRPSWLSCHLLSLCHNRLLTSFTFYFSISQFPREEFDLFSSSFQTRSRVLLAGLVSGVAAFVLVVHPCSILPWKVWGLYLVQTWLCPHSRGCGVGRVPQKAESDIRISATVFIKGGRSECKRNWSTRKGQELNGRCVAKLDYAMSYNCFMKEDINCISEP